VRFHHPGFRVAALALEQFVIESDLKKLARIKEKIRAELVQNPAPPESGAKSGSGGKP